MTKVAIQFALIPSSVITMIFNGVICNCLKALLRFDVYLKRPLSFNNRRK